MILIALLPWPHLFTVELDHGIGGGWAVWTAWETGPLRGRRSRERPGPMTLLVVEDEPRVASFLVKGLTAHGYTVDHVSTGRDALARLEESPVELMVLDLGLPDIDGFDVLRGMRAAGRELPVIILTARSEEDGAVQGLGLGAIDYVTKPFSFVDLLSRIRACLGHQPPDVVLPG